MTGPPKPDIMTHFSNSILLNVFNLHTQVYTSAKFHPHMPNAFGAHLKPAVV